MNFRTEKIERNCQRTNSRKFLEWRNMSFQVERAAGCPAQWVKQTHYKAHECEIPEPWGQRENPETVPREKRGPIHKIRNENGFQHLKSKNKGWETKEECLQNSVMPNLLFYTETKYKPSGRLQCNISDRQDLRSFISSENEWSECGSNPTWGREKWDLESSGSRTGRRWSGPLGWWKEPWGCLLCNRAGEKQSGLSKVKEGLWAKSLRRWTQWWNWWMIWD